MEAGTLIAYFAERDEARRALRELQRRGFRRAAWVHKTADGDIHIRDPFLWRRALGATLTAIVFGGLAGVASLVLHWPVPILSESLSILVSILAGGLIGTLFGGVWIRRSKYGVERRLLDDHARWLVSEETVLIIQAPIETLRGPVAILRESGDIPPAVFVLHPKCENPIGDVRSPGAPLAPTQIQEHAKRLATDHEVDPRPRRNAELLKRVRNAHQWIHQACLDLSEASRLEQGTPPTAEWILDNEYVIESNARDVQLNLPRRFYQELPALANEPYRGLPRIYGLAKELVSYTELRLDRENMLAFIEAYQSVHALTIGELWAVPQMLRIALIESIRDLAVSTLTELREGQIADFWANRLITANRRDSKQLFTILAELAVTQPGPSPYFTTQLVDHLYDEDAALVLVQSWLERTYRKSLSELNLREQNRQTKDQISIGNAFTSLRRSLIPATSVGLLTASWLTSPQIGWISTFVIAMQLLFHPLSQPFTMATTRRGLKSFSFSKVAHDLLRTVADAALLVHQAGLALDAILRVWYRRLISHRGLLEWTSAQVTHRGAPRRQPLFVAFLGLASLFSGIVGWAVQRWMPSSLVMAIPWLVLWFLSPLIGWLLNLRPQAKQKQFLLPEKDLRFLRMVARRTWVPVEAPDPSEPLAKKRVPREPSALLPFMELPYFNSLGGFTPDGREYAIYLGPNTHTPAPWVNVIANPAFGTLVSETGSGFTWYGKSQRNRLTQWSNDPVMDPPSEAV